MAKQGKISYSSAYLKYQLLKGAWFVHKKSIEGQLQTVYDFLNNKFVMDDNQEEMKMTIPYTLQISSGSPEGAGKNVSVIPIMGSLMKKDYCGAAGMQTIVQRIKEADEADSVSGIILHIDSAGGTVDGTQELANTVKNTKKPILAFADGLAASAAYWIGSSADKFIAKDTTTEVGSIGVVLSFIDSQKMMEDKGYVFHDIFADQSSEKWKEMLDAQKGDYSTLKEWTLNPLATEFQEAVRENREGVSEKALKGRVFLARQAKKLKLIDGIGDFDYALGEIGKLINHKNIKIMEDGKVNPDVKTEDNKNLVDKVISALKPEVKDISEDTKADYETRLIESKTKIEDLEKTISELKTAAENYGVEKVAMEKEINDLKDATDLNSIEMQAKKDELDALKSKLSEKAAEPTLVENDEDKLEIGKLSEEEAAWLKEAEKMKESM